MPKHNAVAGITQAADGRSAARPGVPGTRAVIERTLRPAGRRIVDIGCGTGGLVAWLHRQGAHAVGIDPNTGLLRAAADRLPGFWIAARAEHMPLADKSRDAALFFNSLHHIPESAMRLALAEAHRVLRPGGDLLVIEPLACGAYFELLRPLDDETEVRAAALAAIDALPRNLLEPVERLRYETFLDYTDVAAVIAAFTRADPARAAAIDEALPVIAGRFTRLGQPGAGGGRRFVQPMLALRLRRPRLEDELTG